MLFNSYIFVFIFFPICLLGYYGLLHFRQDKAAKIFLTVMSLWFYGYFNVSYLLIMVGSIAVNYFFHYSLSRHPKKQLMILAVACNLGVLFYFKYFDFCIYNIILISLPTIKMEIDYFPYWIAQKWILKMYNILPITTSLYCISF